MAQLNMTNTDQNTKGNIMKLKLVRISSQHDSTIGVLYKENDNFVTQNKWEFLSFTMEDEFRNVKVYGETRIPEGTYEIKLRTVGGFHSKYSSSYPDFHKGMLWLQDVPGFEYVLIHKGNTDEDSAGCILVGYTANENITQQGSVGSSGKAYVDVYKKIVQYLIENERVFLTIENLDGR